MSSQRTWFGRRIPGVLVAVLVAVAASGCAQALREPMPEMKGQLALTVAREQPSKWNDMPIGVHQVPETSVYVSGHQGAAGVGMLFGIIGVAAAHAAAQSTGEKKTADAAQYLKLDIPVIAEKVVTEELERRRDLVRFVRAGGAADGTLEVIPFVVLNFIGDDLVRPWAVLKTALKDKGGDEKWKTRYIASQGEVRKLTGDASWTSNEGMPLRSAIDGALRAAVDVLLRDVAGTLRRGPERTVKVKGHWVWVKQPMEVSALVLDETDETIVVAPKVMDGIVFAGISVLHKKAVQLTAESE